MRFKLIILSIFTIALLTASCGKKGADQVDQTPVVTVKAAKVLFGDIAKSIQLNGKTIYLKKNIVSSPISGYILRKNVKFGDRVQKNELLFEIQTKENKALDNSNSAGIIKVLAPSSGTINTLNINETGGYVLEGAELCSLVENKDVLVQVNVPFENISLAKTGTNCKLLLSDNSTIDGKIYQIMPIVDEVNQTQQVIIKPFTNRSLPENLYLTVQLLQLNHKHSCLVPKNAVMSNEMQTEFWVMKIVDNKTALKTIIKKGIENDDQVEIVSSNLNNNDLIITEGAYGLNDSTEVKVEK